MRDYRLLLAAWFLWAAVSAHAGELRVGFGRRDITPPPGSEIPGFLTKKVGTGIADSLFVVAAVFDSGPERVAVVGIDSLCIMEDTVRAARERIESQTGIPPSHVLIGASHTHTGGPIRPSLDGTVDQPYMNRVLEALVGAVTDAWNAREASEMAITTGHAPGLAFNRRFLVRDGREITHPGKPGTPHHGDIVRPAAPVDDRVGVLAVRRPGGAIRGFLVHFGCHNTIMSGDDFSADYVGALRRHLAERYGSAIETAFLLGPCGDVTQIDNLSPEKQGGPEYCDRFGAQLARAVERSLTDARWQSEAQIAAVRRTVPIAIRALPDPDRERPAYGLGSGSEAFFEAERQRVAQERARHPNVTCEVQGIRIGPLGIVTNGGELFCEYGLRIQECSRHPATWVATLANQWIGYIPTANACAAGGYEPRTRRGSKLDIDAGQRIVEASLAVLSELVPASQPSP